jgi:hypothetical protein
VAKLAGILGIRMLGRAVEGEIKPVAKPRGEAKSLQAMLDEMMQLGYDGGKVRISHCENEAAAKKVADGRRFFVTTLAVMLPLSLFSLYRYTVQAPLPRELFGAMLLPALAGGATGACLLRRLSTRVLNRIFATVTALSGILMLF